MEIRLLCLTLTALLCFSCSDVEYVVNVDQQMGIVSLSEQEFKERDCDASSLGQMVYVNEFAVAFYCGEQGWDVLKGMDGYNGVNGKNGRNGKNGLDGVDGENGKFCTVVNFGEQVFITCDADTLTVNLEWNIHEGCSVSEINGDSLLVSCEGGSVSFPRVTKGSDGTSASSDNLDVAKVVALQKCGEKSYDDAVSFCYENVVYRLCGGLPFDPLKEKCVENSVLPKDGFVDKTCGGETYDITTDFCYEGEVLPLCDGKVYDPMKKKCLYNSARDYIVDERDGKTYAVTTIGNQVWLAENLNFDGYGVCARRDSTCEKNGRYYTWAEAMKLKSTYNANLFNLTSKELVEHQGICPDGFHIPSKTEYSELLAYVKTVTGDTANPSAYLRAKGEYPLNDFNSGTDEFGFSAVLAGRADSRNGFIDIWSSTEASNTSAWYITINASHPRNLMTLRKTEPRSVRCLMNSANLGTK